MGWDVKSLKSNQRHDVIQNHINSKFRRRARELQEENFRKILFLFVKNLYCLLSPSFFVIACECGTCVAVFRVIFKRFVTEGGQSRPRNQSVNNKKVKTM